MFVYFRLCEADYLRQHVWAKAVKLPLLCWFCCRMEFL